MQRRKTFNPAELAAQGQVMGGVYSKQTGQQTIDMTRSRDASKTG
jgi:hypothetical protein